jgi:hypothetical protein
MITLSLPIATFIVTLVGKRMVKLFNPNKTPVLLVVRSGSATTSFLSSSLSAVFAAAVVFAAAIVLAAAVVPASAAALF